MISREEERLAQVLVGLWTQGITPRSLWLRRSPGMILADCGGYVIVSPEQTQEELIRYWNGRSHLDTEVPSYQVSNSFLLRNVVGYDSADEFHIIHGVGYRSANQLPQNLRKDKEATKFRNVSIKEILGGNADDLRQLNVNMDRLNAAGLLALHSAGLQTLDPERNDPTSTLAGQCRAMRAQFSPEEHWELHLSGSRPPRSSRSTSGAPTSSLQPQVATAPVRIQTTTRRPHHVAMTAGLCILGATTILPSIPLLGPLNLNELTGLVSVIALGWPRKFTTEHLVEARELSGPSPSIALGPASKTPEPEQREPRTLHKERTSASQHINLIRTLRPVVEATALSLRDTLIEARG